MRRKFVPWLIIFLLLLSSCSNGAVVATAVPLAATAGPTVRSTAEATVVPPTATPVPPTATPVPTPAYAEPVVLIQIEGTGNRVTDNYILPQCSKAVFYWSVQPSAYGNAALIVRLYNVDTSKDTAIVNELASDVTAAEGLTGAILQALRGGEYYFATENASGDWTLRIECQDGVAPVAAGELLVAGTGISVTGNYALPACNKSIFAWSVTPSKYGNAAIIVYLVKVEDTPTANNLVNKFAADLTEPLTGEAVQKLSGGLYYLTITNTGGRTWQVQWECRD